MHDDGVQECDTSPVVVHCRLGAFAGGNSFLYACSAGVGRSGCYIVIDAMLHQMRRERSVNIYSYLRHIRAQRAHLVQTVDQYKYCYEVRAKRMILLQFCIMQVLREATKAGHTEVALGNVIEYIDTMLPSVDERTKKTLLQLQYEVRLKIQDQQFTFNFLACPLQHDAQSIVGATLRQGLLCAAACVPTSGRGS